MNLSRNYRKYPDKEPGGQEIQTRRRLMELFPRISYDVYTNKKLRDLEIEDAEETPKNNKVRERFTNRNRREWNDQVGSIGSKETDRFGGKIRNPQEQSFTYQSVHSFDRSTMKREGVGRLEVERGSKIVTEPNEEVDTLFGSLEENLNQCDKILSKLGGLSPEVKLIQKQPRKVAPIEWKREIEIPSSLSIRRESRAMLRELEGGDKNEEDLMNKSSLRGSIRKESVDNPFISFKMTRENLINNPQRNEDMQRERYRSLNIDKYNDKYKEIQLSVYNESKKPLLTQYDQDYRPKSKELLSEQRGQKKPVQDERAEGASSVVEIRRRRINEIIRTSKNKVDNPIELSFTRLRQRGENLFNRVLRVKEKSKGGDYIYQSQMMEKYKYNQ